MSLGGVTIKKELLEQKASLMYWFIKMGHQEILLCHLLLAKCIQALIIWLKKPSLCNTGDKTNSLKCEQSFS